MPLPWIVSLLTALALAVVVLTRLRLGNGKTAAGRSRVSPTLLNVHTIAGLTAVMIWVFFLFDQLAKESNSLVGVIGLAFFWITAVAGIMILVRWSPTSGKHSSGPVADGWGKGPGLSIVAHVGLVLVVCLFTWAYLTGAV